MPKAVKFFGLLAGTILLLLLLRATALLVFNPRQILSIGIFSMFIFGTLLYGEFRLAFAFGGIALLMACGLLTVDRFTQAASLDVLVFLIGTFLVIGFLEESRFFEHVVSAIIGAIGPRPQLLLITLMILASLASALVGEVTAILFMAGAMLHLTNKYKLNPAPFVIMLVFACNNGSAMSSVGNPIGVLIALKTGLSFTDFLRDAAPVALAVDVVTFVICRWWFADSFEAFGRAVQEEFAAKTLVVARPAMAVAGGDGGGGDEAATLPAEKSNPPSDSFYGADDPADVEARRAFRLSWVILGLTGNFAGYPPSNRRMARRVVSFAANRTKWRRGSRGRWIGDIQPSRGNDDGGGAGHGVALSCSSNGRKHGNLSNAAWTGGRCPSL